MSYEQTIATTWKKHHLFSALLELTYRCNLDCAFCYNDLELHGTPMSFAEYERVLDELGALGCLHLTLSGGEPLAHPDFFAIGAKARELGFVVRIKSNGHALSGSMAARVKNEIDPFIVELSLHGATAATHDRQTRVAGSFERLLANLEELPKRSLRFKINTTLTRWNESEIEGMFAIADRFDVALTIDPEVTPRDNGDLAPLDLTATPEGLKHLTVVQSERAAGTRASVVREGDAVMPETPTDRHCGAGASGIAIDPYGNVYPCVQWRRPIGNVHDTGLAAIWTGNDKLDEIRGITVQAKDVVAAENESAPFALVGFCPGVSEMATGDPLSVPDSTRERARILSELPLHPVQ